MANDLMRTGPRGASDQSANLSPKVIRLLPVAAVTATLDDNTAGAALTQLTGVTNRALLNGEVASPTVSPVQYVAAKSADRVFYGLPGVAQDDTWHGQWVVRRIFAVAAQEVWLTTDSGTMTAGIFALVPGGPPTITSVTTLPALKTSGVIPLAAMPNIPSMYEPVLNGEGAGLVDNGGTGTGLVSYKLGRGAGQYTQAGVDIRGNTQFLGVGFTSSSGDGKYNLYAEIVPAGGENYSK